MTPHEESLLLARGCETYRALFERWVGIAVERELRLLAATRVIEQQIATIAEQHAEALRKDEQIAALTAEIACRSGVPK